MDGGGPGPIESRLASRPGHYAGPSLLRSQLDALEVPGDVPTVDVAQTPAEMLAATRRVLGVG